MKILIIGLGTIGKTILKNLSHQGHDVTIIDENKNKIEKPILNFKKDQYVGDWFSCSFI